MKQPKIIDFKRIGEPGIGYISIAEVGKQIPFQINRTFWTYYTPESIVRGRHAHHITEMVLIALHGRITVFTEMPDGTTETFILDSPDKGVYMPPYCWHTMQYSHNAVQMVLASTAFDPEDYIRNYEEFEKLKEG